MLSNNLKYFIEEVLENHKKDVWISLPKFEIKRFFVKKGILNPKKSWVSYELSKFLKNNNHFYQNKEILDMGCGSGIQGIITSLNGAKKVTFVDMDSDAIETTKTNIKNLNIKNSEIIQTNLFKEIKGKYDIIIFNHPFLSKRKDIYHSKNTIIFAEDNLLDKFFNEIEKYLKNNSILIMPYSHLAGRELDPKRFIKRKRWKYKEKKLTNQFGEHSIYIIYPNINNL